MNCPLLPEVPADNTDGKQVYEQTEARLADLRDLQKQQWRIEQEQAIIANQFSALSAKIEAENSAIGTAHQPRCSFYRNDGSNFDAG